MDALICERSNALKKPTEIPAAQATPQGFRPIRADSDTALLLQHLDDSRGIESLYFTQKAGAFENLDVVCCVQPVFAVAALGSDQAEIFPRPDHRGRHARERGHIADFKVWFCPLRLHKGLA